ncbi:MAG: malate dehydrogenase [Planctomycetota bacterium]|jgi:malate dehydrogenase
MPRPKVGVIGAGHVGETTALSLVKANVCDVVISDIVQGMPVGKGLDMSQSRWIDHHQTGVLGTDRIEDMRDCRIIVITAGVPRKPGMSREQLQDVNTSVIRDICGKIRAFATNPVLIVVTNPLDVMTYAALKITQYTRNRVIGMAGVLDSTRLAHFVAEKLGVSVMDVSATVLGTHGDAMVALPRYTTVAGIPVTELLSKEDIEEAVRRTRDAGAEIVKYLRTGSAYYAPASSIRAMVEAILFDQNRILPCAVYLEGEYGLKDVVIGVPCKLGEGGMKEVLELKLSKEERDALHASAGIVKKNIGLLKL